MHTLFPFPEVSSTLIITQTKFRNNRANDTKGGGGALYTDIETYYYYVDANLTNCVFTDNLAAGIGGAIAFGNGVLSLEGSLFKVTFFF
jgi:predicted outer membrane repeat protein